MKDAHIANMYRVQNRYLRNTIRTSVKGFSSLDIMITVPGYSNSMTLHQWLLTFKTEDGARQLFTSVDVDPNNINIFAHTSQTEMRQRYGSMSFPND
eukprot:7483029-Ditylum_brightwellii.AAC.1